MGKQLTMVCMQSESTLVPLGRTNVRTQSDSEQEVIKDSFRSIHKYTPPDQSRKDLLNFTITFGPRFSQTIANTNFNEIFEENFYLCGTKIGNKFDIMSKYYYTVEYTKNGRAHLHGQIYFIYGAYSFGNQNDDQLTFQSQPWIYNMFNGMFNKKVGNATFKWNSDTPDKQGVEWSKYPTYLDYILKESPEKLRANKCWVEQS